MAPVGTKRHRRGAARVAVSEVGAERIKAEKLKWRQRTGSREVAEWSERERFFLTSQPGFWRD